MKTIVYDLETFENCFLAGFKLPDGSRATFEMSDRKNEREALIQTLMWLKNEGYTMVGFNNLGFDYHIIHKLLLNPLMFTYTTASEMANEIIGSQYGDRKYPIQYTDRIIPQLDLFTMNHFDNAAKRTSLKKLEYNMRMDSIEDLPFDLRPLNSDEKDLLIKYMHHDIDATEMFFNKCKEQIDLRLELKAQGLVDGDVLNMSDVKIGEQFFVKRLGRNEFYVDGKKKQTHVSIKPIRDVIFPYIHFTRSEFNDILNQFKSMVWQDKVEFPYPKHTIDGLEYVYGRGGIHASRQGVYHSDENYQIVDLDVTSMYPSIAIVNRMKPSHLSDKFTTEYANLKAERVKLPKQSALSKVLKLALNGTFGNSGNPYSFFFDNSYLLGTTINGQLLITMLIDRLLSIPDLEIIQANTDGVTIRVARSQLGAVKDVKSIWSQGTALDLEEVTYKSMWIRDVNNYLAVTDKGKVKAKGAYAYPESESDYDGNWNKNYSCMIIPKVVRNVLINSTNIYDELFKAMHNNQVHDFTLLHSNSSGGYLYVEGKKMGKNTRYLVTTDGKDSHILYPPKGLLGSYKRKNGISDQEYQSVLSLIGEGVWDNRIHTGNKSKYTERKIALVSDKLVTECNDIRKANLWKLDFNWYASEISKLTEMFQ